jgi:hypothetical protein
MLDSQPQPAAIIVRLSPDPAPPSKQRAVPVHVHSILVLEIGLQDV